MDVTVGELECAWEHLEAWFRQQTFRIDIETVLTQCHLAGNGTARKYRDSHCGMCLLVHVC